MKRLLLVLGAAALLAIPAVANADASYSASASTIRPASFTVTSTGGTFTAVASFQKNATWQGYTLLIEDASGIVCRQDTWVLSGGTYTETCSLTDAAAGQYTVSFYPTKGKSVEVSIAVSGSVT